MRHIKLIACAREVHGTPNRASTSGSTPLQIKMQFIVDLTDWLITVIMQKASTL